MSSTAPQHTRQSSTLPALSYPHKGRVRERHSSLKCYLILYWRICSVVKVVLWSRGGSPDEPGWSKPHTHSNSTNLALFRNKITLYRFSHGGSYYCRGLKWEQGAEPPSPLHFNHWICLSVRISYSIKGHGLLQPRRLRPLNGPIRHPQAYSWLKLRSLICWNLRDFLMKLAGSPTVKYRKSYGCKYGFPLISHLIGRTHL